MQTIGATDRAQGRRRFTRDGDRFRQLDQRHPYRAPRFALRRDRDRCRQRDRRVPAQASGRRLSLGSHRPRRGWDALRIVTYLPARPGRSGIPFPRGQGRHQLRRRLQHDAEHPAFVLSECGRPFGARAGATRHELPRIAGEVSVALSGRVARPLPGVRCCRIGHNACAKGAGGR